MDLIKVENNGVSAKELYDFLFEGVEKPTPFSMWIKRRINEYEFTEGKDFVTYLLGSTGGRKLKDYAVSIDMAKELSMAEKTKKGRQTRQYFIKCEKRLRKLEVVRLAGVEVRKTLTDKVDESGENDRMHGKGYSNYTKLAYNLCGLNEKYKAFKKESKGNFRDILFGDDLKRVETVEKMISSLLELGKEYSDIKNVLEPVFKDVKKIEE
jgi:phage anti-repressor protein